MSERMTGLLNLKNLESMGDDDVISMNINESTDNEFAEKNPDTNHPEEHFDKDATAAKETTIPVPEGDKETPSAKPEDEASVTIPEGDKEAPAAKPEDEKSIPVPAKVTLTSDQYNGALASLKKSFQECVEVISILENANVVDEEVTVVDQQEEFVENAILEAMESGPVFEAVKRDDKDAVKEIVKKLRPQIDEYLTSEELKFYKPSKFASLLINQARLVIQLFNERLWQNLGVVIVDDITDIVDKMNEKFAEELGDYKILAYMTPASIVDIFRVKFNWKNFKNTYMLIIDKKFPSELKDAIDEDEKEYKAEEDNKDKEQKEE